MKPLTSVFARLGLPLASLLLLSTVYTTRGANAYWGAVPGTSADTNWSDAANWPIPPGNWNPTSSATYFNEVDFTGVGANANNNTAVNNVLDNVSTIAQMPMYNLDYIATNGNYTTLIDPGITMIVGVGNHGSLTAGADQLNGSAAAPANAVETVTITGSGAALSITGADANLWVSQGSPTPGDTHNIILDLSGLDNFADNNGSANGNFIHVAAGSASGATSNENGTLYLAKTNTISLGDDFEIVDQPGSNSLTCAVYLGINNSILSSNLVIGGLGTGPAGALMKFNPAFLGGPIPPTASVGGTASDGRIVNFFICNTNGGAQFAGAALCDFTGGSVSVMARTMQLGQGGTAGANSEGTLTLDNGVVNVNNATIGNQEVSGGGSGVGVVNLNTNSSFGSNATLIVNSTLTLASTTGTLNPATAGTINLNGGALSATTIVNGGGTGAINSTGGSISLTSAGTPAAPISVLALTNSTLNLAVSPASTNIYANLTTGGSGNTINITSIRPSPAYPVTITLMKYPSSIGGAGYNFSLSPLPSPASGFLSNDTVNSSIDLVLTAGPLTFTWTGSVNGDWDTTTANWTTGGGPLAYVNGDFVQFLDGATTGTVNLTAALTPGGVTISNNTLSYTFTGSGNLTGGTGLLKQGSGSLVLDNSGINNFTGGVTIGGGALVIGNNDTSGNIPSGNITDNGLLAFARTDNNTVNNAISGTGAFAQAGSGSTLQLSGGNTFTGEVVVTNGSTLQLGSSTALGNGGGAAIIENGSTLDANGFTATKTLMVSGTGVGGNGALTDTGGVIYDNPGPGLATNIILTGDTTFTYPVRWDLGSASGGSVLGTDGQARNLTLSSSSGYFEWYNLSVQAPLSNITVAAGSLGVVGSTTLGDPNGTLVLTPSGTLTFYGPNVSVNKKVDFQAGSGITVGGGNNTMNGGMILEPGLCSFSIGGGTSLTLSNVLTGSGVFDQNSGTGTSVLWGNSPSFTGGIELESGTMVLNGLIGCGVTNSLGATLAGSGTVNGPVDVSGGLNPGAIGGAGTFTAGAGLTLESSATPAFDLAATTGVGGGTNDLVAVTGDLTVNGNNILINPLTGVLASSTYVLMTYSGNLTGSFGTASTVASSRYSFAIDTSVAHQVRLIVTGVADTLAWNNGSGDGLWNVQSSLNWTNLTTHAEDQFFTSDLVLLDDRGGQSPTITIPSGQIVIPSILTNNSTTNYTISGAGKISGSASIVKLGSSTLTMSTTNDFTGNFTIGGGTVQLSGITAVAGATNGALVVSNGATLAVNLSGSYPMGDAGFSNKPIFVSGTGANGQGAIQFSGGPLYSDGNTLGLGQSVTLTGNTAISGTGRLDWGYPGAGTTLSTRGSNYNLTVSVGSYSQWYDIGIDTNLGNFDVATSAGSQQTIVAEALGLSLGNPTNVLTLHSNILFNILHGDIAGSDNGYAKVVHILPGGAWQYQPYNGGAGDYRLKTSFVLETNAGLYFFSVNGGSGSGVAIAGTVTLNDVANFQIGNAPVTFSNVISGVGGFYLNQYGGFPLVFAAANTYQGITDIRSGMELALVGNGSISSSSNISLAASATLDVSGRSDQTLTLASGQTLQGDGTVSGKLAVGAGAAVAPGGVGSIGTLTVTNSISLSGTTEIDVNQSTSTEDQLNCTGGITYGGVLNVSNLAGTLAAGDTFQVFNAASYSGSFSSITPAPGPGLAWDATALATGALKVISTAVPPKFSGISISGGNVILRGTNNTGPGGTYHVLTTTNISVPLSNWAVLTNGSFDSNGNFNSTNALGTSARQFYILRVP